MLESEGKINIFSTSGGTDGKNGELDCAYWPVTIDGSEDLPDELLVDEPQELLGKEIHFRVQVNGAKNIPMDLCKDSFVTYAFKHEPDQLYRTDEVTGKNPDPVWNYKRQHTVDCVSDYILDYFKDGHVSLKFLKLYNIVLDRPENVWVA